MESSYASWISCPSDFQKTLIRDLREGAFLSLASYMDRVNRHYYGTRDPFGKRGDFTTAPEVSQLFGEVIAFSFLDFMEKKARGDSVSILELGPGRGTLMADFLRVLTQVPETFARISEVGLVEMSPFLRAKQQEVLAPFAEALPLKWYDSLEPPAGDDRNKSQEASTCFSCLGSSLFIIANEFLDALPIHQLRRSKTGEWEERVVVLEDSKGLKWSWQQGTPFLKNEQAGGHLGRFGDSLPDSTIWEVSPLRRHVFETLLSSLASRGGQALFIDYGNVALSGETLQALKRHTFVSPLEDPGEADLTSHVSFGELLKTVESRPPLRCSFETQRQFLKRHHIDARLDSLLRRATPEQKRSLLSGCERLLSPDQMGSLFKVLSVFTGEG